MIPDAPGGYAPGPHEVNNTLIDAVHHAIRIHPSPSAKAIYGKVLAQVLALQDRQHAAHATATGAGVLGGPAQAPEDPAGQGGGIVTQNMSPLGWALVNAGGYANHPDLAGSIGHFAGAGIGGGGLAGILAQHSGLPALTPGTPTY